MNDEEFQKSFDDWYWSYAYGSKNACINAVRRSDLPEDEKMVLIMMHEKNMGKES